MSSRSPRIESYAPADLTRLQGPVTCLTEPFLTNFADVIVLGLGLFLPTYWVRIDECLDDYLFGNYRHRYRQISLNRRELYRRQPVEIMARLTHLLVHCHFRTYGPRGHSHGSHFIERMRGYGIYCESDGTEYGIVEGPFLQLMREYGIPT